MNHAWIWRCERARERVNVWKCECACERGRADSRCGRRGRRPGWGCRWRSWSPAPVRRRDPAGLSCPSGRRSSGAWRPRCSAAPQTSPAGAHPHPPPKKKSLQTPFHASVVYEWSVLSLPVADLLLLCCDLLLGVGCCVWVVHLFSMKACRSDLLVM